MQLLIVNTLNKLCLHIHPIFMVKIDRKAHSQAVQAERSHSTIQNMGYKDNAPPLISIMGPRGSGKTTLANSIITHYWKKPKSFVGPVTMKIGRKRFTIYESTSMFDNTIDTLKVSDMIVFVINLQNGLQNDTLELINMMNSQGVPKFCFVLTNYDRKQSNKSVNDIEKTLEKQFSFPIKFFCFKKNDSEDVYGNIAKFARYLETMKYRPIEWKCVHPYIIVDSLKDGFAQGYVRGGPIGYSIDSHIPGFGDYQIENIEKIDDPCSPVTKNNVFYNPFNREDGDVHEEPSNSSADNIFVDNRDIKIFEDDESDYVKSVDSVIQPANVIDNEFKANDIVDNEITNNESNINNVVNNKSNTNNSADDNELESLKKSLKSRFKANASTEDDLIEKFNEEYSVNEQKDLNLLETTKKKEIQIEKELENNHNLCIPGTYVRFPLNLDFKDPKNILVIGSYLPSEGPEIILKAKVNKNKRQKFDLKSNAPYFFSLGWCRFQSIPIFFQNNRFMKYCKEFSEISFYGPSVSVGAGFFIYSYDSEYRILGSGQILDISGRCDIKKKLKLIGHPKSIIGQNVIVQSMFSSNKEADKFLNAKLNTVSGLRGLIKSSIGRDGCFRAVFEGTILMSETIFLKCFVPMHPYKYIEHTKENAEYIRHLKDIKADLDVEESYSDEEPEDAESFEEYVDPGLEKKKARERFEMKRLEKQLPFSMRSVREYKESVALPVPPEQRKQVAEKLSLEERRKKSEEEQARLDAKRKQDKLKKQQLMDIEKSEVKRKGAVKSYLEKKAHKKRNK